MTLFYVDTLEYLRRGGRVGAAAALIGSALAVKPILQIVDGRIAPLEKVRTSARALARLEELAVSTAPGRDVEVTSPTSPGSLPRSRWRRPLVRADRRAAARGRGAGVRGAGGGRRPCRPGAGRRRRSPPG